MSEIAAPSFGPVAMSFAGSGLEIAGWMLLWLVCAFFIIPIPWVLAALCRWFCRSVRFSDGTTAEFKGTGGQVAVWFGLLGGAFLVGCIVLFLGPIRDLVAEQSQGLGAVAGGVDLLSVLPFLLVMGGLALGVFVMVVQWLVYNLTIRPGPPLAFTGSWLGLIGFLVLEGIATYTVIGWAWVRAARYRWILRHIEGRGMRFDFRGTGFEILWRTIVLVVLSIPIVTIPWAYIWYLRWVVSSADLLRYSAEDQLFANLRDPRPTS